MRIITDADFLSWEVFPSGGKFGLPERPKVVFNCLTDPSRRGRYVHHEGDSVSAEHAVKEASDAELQALLAGSSELD
jgi:hypothetical protein